LFVDISCFQSIEFAPHTFQTLRDFPDIYGLLNPLDEIHSATLAIRVENSDLNSTC